MHNDCDDRSHEEFIADLDARIVSTVNAAKAAIALLPPADQARAAAEIAAALITGLERLREAIDEAKTELLDS
ncbi:MULTISPECIES: hypothetical protein [unclassified Bradyrhizobium]|uniref:hypothetical protein n=1 Tax=unclassified Bradyrhizobium TaxID=2631580 RepID=UPI0028E8E5CC|nr:MULTISPECIES: hypothetical protein [unclassified Bradyrhizobium]